MNNHAASEDEWPVIAPADYWEDRYADTDRMWSGNPNASLVQLVADLPPGDALDLGCGEGGDAIWLAQQGWNVTGIDIAESALQRAREMAQSSAAPMDRVRFVATDLSEWQEDQKYDLVTASFFHSPVRLARTEILRRAASLVAAGGHLAIVSHGAAPPWAEGHADHKFLTPEEELAELDLAPAGWSVLKAQTITRKGTGPDGQEGVLDDTVLLLQRKA